MVTFHGGMDDGCGPLSRADSLLRVHELIHIDRSFVRRQATLFAAPGLVLAVCYEASRFDQDVRLIAIAGQQVGGFMHQP